MSWEFTQLISIHLSRVIKKYRDNLKLLEAEGYRYIVGAHLANTTQSFIDMIDATLLHKEGVVIRLYALNNSYDVICTFSGQRYKKDKRQFEKQITLAKKLVAHQEAGKRAKFVKKSNNKKDTFIFDEDLKAKTEKLLGVKGYCTNIAEDMLSNQKIVSHYHDLWHVEQAFRMSKTDLKTRPIFHHSHDAIKAHVLLCFMALMMGKFLEIKVGLSLQRIRDIIWNVHEAHVEDTLTGEQITLQTNLKSYYASGLHEVLKPH